MQTQKHKKCKQTLQSSINTLITFSFNTKDYIFIAYQSNEIQIFSLEQNNFGVVSTYRFKKKIIQFYFNQIAQTLYFEDQDGKIQYSLFDQIKQSNWTLKQLYIKGNNFIGKKITSKGTAQRCYLFIFSGVCIQIFQNHKAIKSIQLQSLPQFICFNQCINKVSLHPDCFITFKDSKYPLIVSNVHLLKMVINQYVGLKQTLLNRDLYYMHDEIKGTIIEMKCSKDYLVIATQNLLWIFGIFFQEKYKNYFCQVKLKFLMDAKIITIDVDYQLSLIASVCYDKVLFIDPKKKDKISKSLSQKPQKQVRRVKWTSNGKILLNTIKNNKQSSIYLYSSEFAI